MTFAAVLSVTKKLCTTIAAVGMSLVAAQTAGQIKLSPQVFSVISLIAIVAGLVSRSVIPEPTPGPFPLRTSGGPGDRVALLLFLGLAASSALLLSCATAAGKQASAIAEKCGAQVAADIVVEVSRGLDTSTAALEADAVKYGVPLVLCVISQLVVIPPSVDPGVPSLVGATLTVRQRNAMAFIEAHR